MNVAKQFDNILMYVGKLEREHRLLKLQVAYEEKRYNELWKDYAKLVKEKE